MKRIFTTLCATLTTLLVASFALSCEDSKVDNVPDDEPKDAPIAISDVSANYNSVTFTVEAENANAIAYVCRKVGSDEISAQDVFSMGKPAGVSEGTFTVSNLESSTDYNLLVAMQGKSGFQGPVIEKFTTEVNTGAASSELSAGIRVDNISEKNFVWEVTNGKDIDFSLTLVRPTIIVENQYLEDAKVGLTPDESITDFINTYGYLSYQVKGAGVSEKINYNDFYGIDLYPGANYTIFTLGYKGDYNDEASLEICELTQLNVHTLPMERIGNPDVKVSFVEYGFTFLRNLVEPNKDAKYWGSIFTKSSEIDEFRAYYDAKEGPGAGAVRLKEYIQYYDQYINEQTEATEYATNVGFDQEGINFSNIALGFDANFVAADQYREVRGQVRVAGGDPAEFEMEVSDVGASTFYLESTLQGNCMRVFWGLFDQGSKDEDLKDPSKALALSRTLWNDGGYAIWRWNEPNDNQDVVYHEKVLVDFEMKSGHAYDLIATGQNYDGSFNIKKVGSFTTLERSYGDYDPNVTVKMIKNSKTDIVFNFDIDKEAIEKSGERMFYSRLYSYEELKDYSDESLRDWLSPIGQDQANIWQLVSNDTEDEDPYNYNYVWAGMEPDTKYLYVWMTENAKGELSNVKKMEVSTLSNDGGDAPGFTISIDPESIVPSSIPIYFTAKATVTPNKDVTAYKEVFVETRALTSNFYDIDDPEDLNRGLYTLLCRDGVPANDVSTLLNDRLKKDAKVWFVAQGQGANGVESKMSCVCFDAEGNIDEQVDVDITEFIAEAAGVPAATATININSPLRKESERVQIPGLAQEQIPTMITIPMPRTAEGEIDGEVLRKAGIPYYSLKECTKQIMMRQ